MKEMLDVYVKLAVDMERGVLAGGGALHSDCEAIPLVMGANNKMSGVQIGYP